jgi:hypothetical protein
LKAIQAQVNMNPIIPPFQPVPFPLPLWLIETLLVAGFLLHVIPMNIAWMGGFVSSWFLLQKGHPFAPRLGYQLAKTLPIVLSFAITQGIVPLLFLQLEYGPLYYTASIMMAVPWLALLFVLMAGYYGLYWFKYKFRPEQTSGAVLLFTISGLFTLIAMIFTSNMTLMLNPDMWTHMIQTSGNLSFDGLLLYQDPIFWTRFIHTALGALAVTGLAIGCFGLYYKQKDPGYSQWLIQQGSGLFLMATLLNVGAGLMYLGSFPAAVQEGINHSFKLAKMTLHSGYLLAALALVCGALAWKNASPKWFQACLWTTVLTLADMALLRHWVRVLYTQPFFHPEKVPVSIQWDLLIAFLILTVGLLVYLTWLVRLSLQAAASPANSVSSQNAL